MMVPAPARACRGNKWAAVAAEFALQFAGQGQIGAVGQILQPQRQQDIAGRDLVGANIDRAHAVLGRPDEHPKRPRMPAFFADAQRHPSGARPAQAEADILERPFVAALLIVDDQDAVLQADFVEVLSVEPGEAQAVQPIETGQQSARGRRGRADCASGAA